MRIYFVSEHQESTRITYALSKLKAVMQGLELAYSVHPLQAKSQPIINQEADTSIQDSELFVLIGHEQLERYNVQPLHKELASEGFELRKERTDNHVRLYVLGHDETGVMYGLLELAERLQATKSIDKLEPCLINARFPFRALKFNLPWSSYRKNECFELQHACVKDLKFWEQFLNMMLDNRYNVLTLWNLHPFPFMLRTKSFPLATPFSDEELAEWKQYWTTLFHMAKERGIETYLINWNIIVSEAFTEHYDPQAVHDRLYHYGDSYTTDDIKQYTRESITQLIDEYPDLTGFGVSLGERMNDMSPESIQQWIEDVYYEGMSAASRPIKFIHRAPFSVDPAITRTSIEQNHAFTEPVWLEVKFNWSHAYSSPKLLLTHGGSSGMEGYWNPPPSNYKITWMVRNEDFFTLRWAQPDFVREHIRTNGQEYVGGYYVGSECFIPGTDYSHIQDSPHIHWDYAFQKHWLYYMLWGRLLYAPDTSDDVFIQAINQRLSISKGDKILSAYSKACRMPMALASFYHFTWDFTLYAEGFLSTGESEYNDGQAFISLEDLLESHPMDPDYLSIKEYVHKLVNQQSMESFITPLQLADQLERDAQDALCTVTELLNGDPRLDCEVADIIAWSQLSLYFAKKLRAAVSYELYRSTGNEAERQLAIYWLEAPHAAAHWERLVAITKSHYKPQPLMHLGKTLFSWELFLPQVYEDIEYVRERVII
ncbi:alpha-glucuronidase family glycosyl hydrolase [Paenibacillus camelliae]|uniref:alpha-glucuronidase family glycosyl hydrolase n=1 Tax=Paenibacillus camelliae TaxID=512410 RepID=UPI00203A5741|nr:hypothetical protein [Paenibacillus camelliae]MCM3632672.1 hypothetical protein [Paenibacillus camelliae]